MFLQQIPAPRHTCAYCGNIAMESLITNFWRFGSCAEDHKRPRTRVSKHRGSRDPVKPAEGPIRNAGTACSIVSDY